MAIQEANTQTSAEPNSEVMTTTQTSGEQETGSSTSTTEAEAPADDDDDADTIDLGKPAGDVDASSTSDDDNADDSADDQQDDAAALFGAPEADYELTLDEGVTLDKTLLDQVTPIAKQLNLSNAGLALLAKEVLPHVQQQAMGNLETQIVEQRRTWEVEAREIIAGKNAAGEEIKLVNELDKPISFDGNKLKDVEKIAAKALDHLAPKGFREFLDETGLGVHPMMIAFGYNAGKNIAEDTTFEPSSTSTARPKTREEKFYG